MEELLSIKNLKVNFYTYRGVVEALNGISFTMYKGESLGLVGETGCGKSVTSLAILKLIPEPGKILEGEIIFEGENLLEKSEQEIRELRGSKIAIIFQDPTTSLNPVFRVGEQISETIVIHQKIKKSETWKQVIELMNEVKISTPEPSFSFNPSRRTENIFSTEGPVFLCFSSITNCNSTFFKLC